MNHNDFKTQYDANHQKFLVVLFSLGVTGCLLPVAMLELPAPIMAASMVGGLLMFVAGAVNSIDYPIKAALAKGRIRANEETRKTELAAAYDQYGTLIEIANEKQLADQIVHALGGDPNTCIHYFREKGLEHFLPAYFPELMEAPPEAAPATEEPQDPIDPQGEAAATPKKDPKTPVAKSNPKRQKVRRTDLNYGWLTPELSLRNKFVVAGSGGGKSTLLKQLIQMTLKEDPEAEIVLIDPHLPIAQLVEAESQGFKDGTRLPTWGLHETAEAEAEFIPHDPVEVKIELNRVLREARDRINGSSTNRHRIHVIVDEVGAEFFNDPENSETGAALAQLFIVVAGEARKARITMTIAARTPKKYGIGIPMPSLNMVTWIIMGSAFSEPKTPWPSDIDAAELGKQQRDLQETLRPEDGRAVVVRHYVESRTTIELGVMPPPSP